MLTFRVVQIYTSHFVRERAVTLTEGLPRRGSNTNRRLTKKGAAESYWTDFPQKDVRKLGGNYAININKELL